MEQEHFSLTNFTHIIFKRLWIIILFTLVACLTSAYISYYVINPVYQAEVNLLVRIEQTKDTPTLTSNIDDSLKLVSTYQDIVQSPFILKEAQKKLNDEGYNIRIDPEDISVENIDKSQVLELQVKDTSSTTAALIANGIADSVEDNIQNITNSKSNYIKVMNSAHVASDSVSPRPLLIIGITTFISFIVSIWIVLFIANISKNRKRS